MALRHLPALGVFWLLSACADARPENEAQAQSESIWLTTDATGARLLDAQIALSAQVPLPGSSLFALELPRSALPEAAEAVHAARHRCGGFALHGSWQAAAEAAATPAYAFQAPALDNGATVRAMLPLLQTSNLQKTIEDLSAFPTRLHSSETGKQASLWIRDLWQGYAKARKDVKIELISHKKTPQSSVALTITGSKSPTERVVLGGHLDSINLKGGNAPGADDNASGIAVLSEVARVALESGYEPERSVVFYAYAAEEIGLVGSDEIAATAKAEAQNVVGVLQLDMTNYNPAPKPYLAIVTDFTDPGLNVFARSLIEQYVGLPWKDTECGYACSDHGPWNKRGFAAHYVHESTTDESNDRIHTADDTLALTNGKADHSLHFARYGVAFMAELAKGTAPECDASRPCAAGKQCEAGSCVAPPSNVAGAGGAAGMSAAGSGGDAKATGGAGGTGETPPAGSNTGGAMVASAGAPAVAGTAASGAPTLPAAATPNADQASSCSCRVAGDSGSGRGAVWLLLAAGLLWKRRSSA